ncbi:MAG: hypothetical protein AAGB35_06180 [Pseudomonadota bacterium]
MRSLKNISAETIQPILAKYQLNLHVVDQETEIPHSFWGSPEAGRLKSELYARIDTPIHSIFHESAHYVCMTEQQRKQADIDAGGSAIIEDACCYLQILWSDYLKSFNRHIQLHDMDRWGYSFRLGSATRWFYADSDDARLWLLKHNIITEQNEPTWEMRF